MGAANHNHAGDGRKHALVEHEQDVGDGRHDGGGAQHVHETKVVQVANVLAGRVRERERVAPEEPLEGDEGRAHY